MVLTALAFSIVVDALITIDEIHCFSPAYSYSSVSAANKLTSKIRVVIWIRRKKTFNFDNYLLDQYMIHAKKNFAADT